MPSGAQLMVESSPSIQAAQVLIDNPQTVAAAPSMVSASVRVIV
jgi:hypothetical protein